MANLPLPTIAALGIGLLMMPPLVEADQPAKSAREVVRTGKVVELSSSLVELGVVADEAMIAGQMVLKGDDGEVIPLLPSQASRALFLDDRLRDRPAEVKGLVHEGLPYLEVLNFRVQEQGTFQSPEYYCDICAIKARYPQACPCCQDTMELRFLRGSNQH